MTRPLSTSFSLALTLSALWLILPGSLLAANVDDEERWYQIELVIFENKGSLRSDQDATEIWARDPGKVDLNQAMDLLHQPPSIDNEPQSPLDLNTPPSLPITTAMAVNDDEQTPPRTFQAFELLPTALLTMASSIERLNAAKDYQPLLHIGWRQPVPERHRAKATPILIDSRTLLIHTAKLDELETTADGQATTFSFSLDPGLEQGPDEIITDINENFVNGTLTLTRGRYLHLNLDLLYQRQANTPQLFSFFGFGNVDTTPELYRLTQKRRLRRGEIHYFDHPKFGVLAMITAVKEDESNQVQTIPLNRPR